MTATITTATATTAPSIHRMFYTSKRTQIILESGWVNAKGIKVEGVKIKKIEKISITCNSINKQTGEIAQKFLNCVHVTYISASGKRCSQFVSCRAYLTRATNKRKEEAENYKAYQNFSDATQWSVYPKPNPNVVKIETTPQKDTPVKPPRTVTTVREGVFCDCEDFEHQGSYLKQHPYLWEKVIKVYSICKHSLCTLNHLGFDSLSKYLKAFQPGGRLNNLSVVMNRTVRSRTA